MKLQEDEFNPYIDGFRAPIPMWLLCRPICEISQSAKLVYGVLTFHAGRDGRSFPTTRAIAAEIGVTRRQVMRLIDELRRLQLIRTEKEYETVNGKPNLKRCHYFFKIHPWAKGENLPEPAEIGGDMEDTTSDEVGGDTNVTTPGDTEDTRVVTPMSPLKENKGREQLGREQQQTSSVGSLRSPTPSLTNGNSGVLDDLESSAPIAGSENSDLDLPVEDRVALAKANAVAATDKAVAQAAANKRKRADKAQRAESRSNQARKNLKGNGQGSKPIAQRKAVDAIEKLWRSEMESAYPDLTVIVKWTAKDRGNVHQMIEMGGSSLVVENTVKYVVRNWKTVSGRFGKGKHTGYPLVGWIISLAATLMPEADTWIKHVAVLEEWEQADADDPFGVPSDLKARYRAAKEELRGIGLDV